LFIAGGLAFAWAATRPPEFAVPRDAAGALGAFGVTYALVLYPLLGLALGHRYPLSPTFGAPCPSVIFTFGILFWTVGRVPAYLLVAPILWAGIGASAAVQWEMLEDLAMPVIAVAAAVFIVRPNRRLGPRHERRSSVSATVPAPTT
jgi:hypothetical protein